MASSRTQKVFGKGLIIIVLAALAAVSLGKVQSVHADNATIQIGQTVNGWIPSGDEIHWYQFEASPDAVVNITMTRTDRDLVPYLALRYHDGHDFQILAVDQNYGRSATAQISALLPVSTNGYWIEAASKGSTAGTFSLSTSFDSFRGQTQQVTGYKVTLSIDKIICWDEQDNDGIDELELTYSMRSFSPTAAVDRSEKKVKDMWMQPGWEFDNFLSLTEQVSANGKVRIALNLKEDDTTSGDETLLNTSFDILSNDLQRLAASGQAEPYFFQPSEYSDDEAYTYELFYSIRVEEIHGW